MGTRDGGIRYMSGISHASDSRSSPVQYSIPKALQGPGRLVLRLIILDSEVLSLVSRFLDSEVLSSESEVWSEVRF